MPPVIELAGELEADAVGIVEVDAQQSGELCNRTDIVDAVRFQAGLDLADALGRHDKCAVLHGADGVPVAYRLLPFRNLEEGEQAVMPISKSNGAPARRVDCRDCPGRCPDPAALSWHERAAYRAHRHRSRSSPSCRRCRVRGDERRAGSVSRAGVARFHACYSSVSRQRWPRSGPRPMSPMPRARISR